MASILSYPFAVQQQTSQTELLRGELQREYNLRFEPHKEYRNRIWKLLTSSFFQRYVPPQSTVLDLGCGWGEFINNIRAEKKFGMDLNPDGGSKLAPEVAFLNQDCSVEWEIPDASLDIVFTSNFFEHLPSKDHLRGTLLQARRCLKPGGKIICMGPNIKYLPGQYWDFWDHYLPLTERSLEEVLGLTGFRVEERVARFLPYTMVNRRHPPLFLVRAYLSMPLLWRIYGEQFLLVAKKSE